MRVPRQRSDAAYSADRETLKKRVKKLYEDGLRMSQIAESFGFSIGRVKRLLVEVGIEPKQRRSYWETP
jgi:hypothetical protein